MGDIFNGQSARLLREDQWRAQSLAEELYAIFLANPQLTPDRPIVSTLGEGEPFSIIRGAEGDDTVVFQFTNAAGEVTGEVTAGDLQAGTGTGGGNGGGGAGTSPPIRLATVGTRTGDTYSLTSGGQTWDGRRVEGDVDGFDVPIGTAVLLFPVAGGGRYFSYPYPASMLGQIISGSGTYSVRAYPFGVLGASVVVSALFPGEVGLPLTAGTWVALQRSADGSFFFVHPKQQIFAGEVQSGSGSTYSVDIGDGTIVSADQLQIDPADQVPSGTKEIVGMRADGTFFLQVGVWVE